MNKQEFIQEAITSEFCPKDFNNIYREFQLYQKLALETLIAFHDVCEKNGIHYQIAYGSLLGAIRDEGQIPWDYDIDVFVPFCEKDILVKALLADLNDKYYFICPEVDSKCRHYMMRITPKGYRSEALHVDVFYIIGAPETGTKEFGEKCKDLFQARYDKLVNVREESFGNIKRKLRLMLNKTKRLLPTIGMLDKKFVQICTKYNIWESRYCISVDDESNRFVYETDKLWNTRLIELPIGIFRIPVEYEYILNMIYGDYKKIFPIKERLDEMIRSYKKLEYYHHKQNELKEID